MKAVIHKFFTNYIPVNEADEIVSKIEDVLKMAGCKTQPTLFRKDGHKVYDETIHRAVVVDQKISLAILFEGGREIERSGEIIKRLTDILGEPV